MEQISYYDELAKTLYMDNDEYNEWRAFVEMCHERKIDPMNEVRKLIQARYDAMLAE